MSRLIASGTAASEARASSGRPGPGEGDERLDIGRREMGRVAHVDLRPELAQIPDEGVDETVAVIEDDDACGHPTVTS